MSTAKDPKRYYRIEAHELIAGLSAELLELSRGVERPDAPARLFRLAHTLKGAANVVGDHAVVETARILEDVLGIHRDTATALTPQEVAEFLRMVEAIEQMLQTENSTDTSARKLNTDEASTSNTDTLTESTIRVELDELDDVATSLTSAELQSSALQLTLRELDVTTRSLEHLLEHVLVAANSESTPRDIHHRTDTRLRDTTRELFDRLGRARRQALARADSVSRELQQARDGASRLELVPASNAFPPLERAAQIAATALGKTIRLETSGGDVRLDRRVLPVVSEALLHLVRNAVDHGIETPAERTAHNKAREGCLKITVQRRGQRVAFCCNDDGTGIDPDRIRELAFERGLVSEVEAEKLDDAAALRLLFRAGFSTRDTVTDLSGRGVGLDVVSTAASKLHGDVTIASTLGTGTQIELVVPVSLTTATVVVLRVEDASVLLPIDSVSSVARVASSTVTSGPNGEVLLHDNDLLPVLRLGKALGLGGSVQRSTPTIATLVITVGDERFAIVADVAQGTTEVVVRPLPWSAGNPLGVAGAALDVEGVARLVLDPRGLLAVLQRHAGIAPEPALPNHVRRHLPILVIDDSLTTRMLEQSILQTAGFEVDVATSAEEGLGMARAREYGLFVVDVEMPGMNGFEFTHLTRNDNRLRNISVILVTSLNSEADKRRGREAGASAYVVKGQFDQTYFLDQVRTLSRAVA